MTRLGTPNQVDHLHHKGSPRHCVIHPNDCWLASRVKIHLAWQFQPNQTSFPNCTSIGGSLSSESRPGIHHVSWLQEEHREIWKDKKKNGVSHLLNLQKSAFSNVSLVFFGPHGSIAASPSFQALCWDQELQPLLQLSGRPLQLQALSYGGGFVGKFRGKPPNLMFDHYWS